MEASSTYVVKRCTSGDLHDKTFWDSANVLSGFIFPWERAAQPDMEFRALHDNDSLYCSFRVRDNLVLTYVKDSVKEEVLHGDRVELFFTTDDALTLYYGLEIDPNGRVYDYEASHYRKFNPAWQWPAGELKINSRQSDDGYEVVVSISMKSLQTLKLLKGDELRAGIFRGKCMEINLTEDRMRWISWIKPQSPFPDFHIPTAFGTLLLR